MNKNASTSIAVLSPRPTISQSTIPAATLTDKANLPIIAISSPATLTDKTNLPIIAISSPATLTDKALYHLCQLYGGNAKTWLRKFAGLLPEVFKRSLHRKHNCSSIHEFAKKLSGMNERTVNKIMNLHERLLDKPHLLTLFESGEQGWSKLEAVAFMATIENEKDLAEKVETLPFRALVLYVKNKREKLTGAGQFQLQNNSRNLQSIGIQLPEGQIPLLEQKRPDNHQSSIFSKSSPQATSPFRMPQPSTFLQPFRLETFTTFSFPISSSSLEKLHIVKRDLEKENHKTLTWNEVIKLWPLKICPTCAKRISLQNLPTPSRSPKPLHSLTKNSPSRHIPKSIQALIPAKHGQICVFPGCLQAYTEFHHVEPFAIYKKHDPEKIYPVCSAHHTLFHAGLIENSDKPPKFWHIRNKAKQNFIDKKAMKYKNYSKTPK